MVASSASKPRAFRLPDNWKNELSATNAVVGEAFWDQSLGMGILLVAVPVQRADGRLLGALAARLNLRGAKDGLLTFAPGKYGQIYLIGTGGNLIVNSLTTSAELMRLSLKPGILERLTKREGAVLTYESVSGVEVLGSLRQVPRVGWAVLCRGSRRYRLSAGPAVSGSDAGNRRGPAPRSYRYCLPPRPAHRSSTGAARQGGSGGRRRRSGRGPSEGHRRGR